VPMPMSKPEIEKLLGEANIAVVATTAPDGSPHAVPTWYEYRNGEIMFHTAKTAFKYKCLAHDPRITLCVDTKEPPYKAVVLKGRASMEEKIDDESIRRMAVHYLGAKLGEAYAKSSKGARVVVVRFKPGRTTSWDYGKEAP
jgi:PPOX class probable F420-dependent enzyme